jgi:hypothetical protein
MSHLISIFSDSTFWIAVGSVLQGVAAIIAYSALRYSVTTFTKTLAVSNYTELDRMYFDLLKTAVEKPHLVNPEAVRNVDQQREYDTYAFMVWNVMESIYDRCHGDDELCETWYPAIDTEELRHGKWLDDPKNQTRFKHRFCRFIEKRYKKHKGHDHPSST